MTRNIEHGKVDRNVVEECSHWQARPQLICSPEQKGHREHDRLDAG